MGRPSRREAAVLAAIIGFAALLRMCYAIYLPGTGRDLVHSDMEMNDTAAWHMCQRLPVEGQPGFNGYHPLSASTYNYAGYIYFLAAIYALFGHNLVAVRVTQAIIGTVTVWLVYALGARVFGRRPGLIAALLTALYLPLVYYTGFLLSETWFVFLQLSVLVVWLGAWGSARPGPAKMSAGMDPTGAPGIDTSTKALEDHGSSVLLATCAGILAGLACISRSAFLPAVPLLATSAWCFPPTAQTRRRRGMLILAMVAGAIVAIAPVTVRNYQIHHRLILVSTNGPSTFLVAHVLHTPFIPREHLMANDSEMQQYHRHANWRFLQKQWPRYLAQLPEVIGDMWFSGEFWPQTTVFRKYEPVMESDKPSRIRMAVDMPGGDVIPRGDFFPDLMRYVDRVLWLLVGFPLGIWSTVVLARSSRSWLVLIAAIIPYMIIPFIAPGFARYRVPAVPLFFILAAQMIHVCLQFRKQGLEDEGMKVPLEKE